MNKTPFDIEAFTEKIPPSLLSSSGKVFYSGHNAFSTCSSLYVIGVNPGGSPEEHSTETVGSHTQDVLKNFPDDWSAYRDESWEGAVPGTYGMAPRILHMFAELGVNPGSVPCSNLFFVRSSRENDLIKEKNMLADLCWPFHAYVIEKLKPKVILCLGKTSGTYIRQRLKANIFIDDFTEKNNRRWQSQAFKNSRGTIVIVTTHPSIADWTARQTDPTPLVKQMLK